MLGLPPTHSSYLAFSIFEASVSLSLQFNKTVQPMQLVLAELSQAMQLLLKTELISSVFFLFVAISVPSTQKTLSVLIRL